MRRRVGLVAALGLTLALVAPGPRRRRRGRWQRHARADPVHRPARERLNLIILGDGVPGRPAEPSSWPTSTATSRSCGRPSRSGPTAATSTSTRSRSPRSTTACGATRTGGSGRDDPRHRPARRADRRQEHRAADDLPERCADPLARGTVYGGAPVDCARLRRPLPAGLNPCETGNQAHNRILDSYVMPVLGIPRTSQNVQTLAIFNTFTYGGIGGTQATTSGGSPQGPLISLHELGHSLGTMADEYPYSSRDVVRPCYTGGEPAQLPPHHLHQHRADGRRPAQVVAVAGRGEPVRRHDRPARGRRHVPVRPAPAERALDHAVDRLRLGPGRPRTHGRPDHRHAQRRPDDRAAHRRRAGRRPTACCGSRPGIRATTSSHVTWRSAADGTVLDTHSSRSLDLDPLDLPAGHGRAASRCATRSAGRDRLGAQPVDRQHGHELRLQRPAVRPDPPVDRRRRPASSPVAAGRARSPPRR